jgi:DNA-binding response OmpR family regulator
MEESLTMRILIVEDNLTQLELLRSLLNRQGFDTDTCTDGAEGLYRLALGGYDLAILDRMLPGMDGVEVLRQYRSRGGNCPVILLTALSAVGDRVTGLDAGADDYLAKPFAPEELLARVRALLRRPTTMQSKGIQDGDVTLYPEDGRLEGPKGECSLSARECRLLQLLLSNPNQALSRETILLRVWGMDSQVEERNIDNFVYLVRRRLKNVGSTLRLSAVRGFGYRLEVE